MSFERCQHLEFLYIGDFKTKAASDDMALYFDKRDGTYFWVNHDDWIMGVMHYDKKNGVMPGDSSKLMYKKYFFKHE